MKPFNYEAPQDLQVSNLSNMNSTVVIADAGDTLAGANTSHDYAIALEESLRTSLNSDDNQAAANEVFPTEWLPTKQDQPTPVQASLLEDRSAWLSLHGDWSKPEKGELLAGTEIFSLPADKALLVSHHFHVTDFAMMAGWTSAALEQHLTQIHVALQSAINSKLVDVLLTSSAMRTTEQEKPSGKPREMAEDLLDVITMSLDPSVGNEVSAYGYLVHADMYRALTRAAHRAGLEDVDDLLGTHVRYYGGEDRGVFALPKMFSAIAFSPLDKDGEWFSVKRTRIPQRQAWSFEILARAYVMTEATAKVKDGEHMATVDAKFPIVTRIKWKAAA
ncbi:hypothetical protein [Serratia marcescens]|uniref:hypothetical protein n=1 Tax=Serratia marcescens TaxID=615 RepID=UPI003FA7DFC7